MPKRGRPEKLDAEHRAALLAIVEADRTATLEEIGEELGRRTGVRAHPQTLLAALREAGWARSRDGSSIRVGQTDAEAMRYGYTDAHRRLEPEQTYPSCLTDPEWALVADIFDNTGARGVPPEYARRLLVDACCYVVRTGCSWRMLPKEFPPWQNVYRTFRRWSEQGKFEQMHDRLRGMWPARVDGPASPWRRYSTRSPRAARRRVATTAMTRASRSRGASAI